MKKIEIKIDKEFEAEFDELWTLLAVLKIECRIEFKTNESERGEKFTDRYFIVEYDYQEVFKKLHRSYGKKRTRMNGIILSIEEVRKRIEKETAEKVAKSLGVSRRTLFRRLAEAEKRGDKYVY